MSKGKHVGTCRTCGSEIVETVNDSLFHEGECNACEYHRYKTQPALHKAANLALDEFGEMLDLMNGAEGPEIEEAVESLNDAVDEASVVHQKKSQ